MSFFGVEPHLADRIDEDSPKSEDYRENLKTSEEHRGRENPNETSIGKRMRGFVANVIHHGNAVRGESIHNLIEATLEPFALRQIREFRKEHQGQGANREHDKNEKGVVPRFLNCAFVDFFNDA